MMRLIDDHDCGSRQIIQVFSIDVVVQGVYRFRCLGCGEEWDVAPIEHVSFFQRKEDFALWIEFSERHGILMKDPFEA